MIAINLNPSNIKNSAIQHIKMNESCLIFLEGFKFHFIAFAVIYLISLSRQVLLHWRLKRPLHMDYDISSTTTLGVASFFDSRSSIVKGQAGQT